MMANRGNSLAVIRAHRLELSKVFANSGICILPDGGVQILHDYLDYLEQAFSTDNCCIDIGEIQEMLLEASCIIRSGNYSIRPEEYGEFLERLTAIYSKGFTENEKERFSVTAPDYADVIEAISVYHPGYDYSEAMGQLLYYLNLLYQHRKGSWKTVYDHILSMPDSIVSIKTMKEGHLQEIHRWVEEGVQNLFDIRRDLQQRVDELVDSASALSIQIEEHKAELSKDLRSWPYLGHHNVASLEHERRIRILDRLIDERDRLVGNKQDKEQIAELIESNIKEFENSLKEARRGFFLRQIRATSQPTGTGILTSLA